MWHFFRSPLSFTLLYIALAALFVGISVRVLSPDKHHRVAARLSLVLGVAFLGVAVAGAVSRVSGYGPGHQTCGRLIGDESARGNESCFELRRTWAVGSTLYASCGVGFVAVARSLRSTRLPRPSTHRAW